MGSEPEALYHLHTLQFSGLIKQCTALMCIMELSACTHESHEGYCQISILGKLHTILWQRAYDANSCMWAER